MRGPMRTDTTSGAPSRMNSMSQGPMPLSSGGSSRVIGCGEASETKKVCVNTCANTAQPSKMTLARSV